ncbi:MAG: outer membrane protein assembly factor BamD, partial [Myxococcota bacterium]
MRVLFCLALATIGCAPIATTGGRGVAYSEDAQQAYENALEAFRRDNCLDAEPAFRRVRREFPYSRFAALAELRVADCKFKGGQYAEAITAYRQFIRFRPSHSQIEYARFRVAESHYKQIPTEWFFSPPTHERDRQATEDALRQLRRYLLDYPDSERIAEAREMMQRCI